MKLIFLLLFLHRIVMNELNLNTSDQTGWYEVYKYCLHKLNIACHFLCLPPASLNQSIKLKVETDEIIERLFLNSYGGKYSVVFSRNSLIYASRVKLIEKIGEGENTAHVYNSTLILNNMLISMVQVNLVLYIVPF